MVYILILEKQEIDLRWRKTKIALARALYKEFNTLILDEATSAMTTNLRN